jgi:hypothetical protein
MPGFGQLVQAAGVVGASGLQVQAGQPETTPHTVRGTVVDSITGEPIYRALVQMGGQFAALTDHEGRFEFEGVTEAVPPWAMKPGYFAENRSRVFTVATSDAAATQTESPPVVIKLVPEAVLSGTVTGTDGGPLEGIPVTLKTLAVSEGMTRWRQRGQTRTNSEGQYRFPELEAGKYAVVTGFHTEGLAEAQSTVAYVPARYPAVVETQASGGGAGAAAAISLGAGERRQADLSPEMEKLYPVTGIVTGYGESRGVGFRVETPGGEEISPMSRFNARTGEFRVMLPGGTFVVTATTYLEQGPMEGRLTLTVPQAPVTGVTFALEPYATIPVEVDVEAVNAVGQGQADQWQPQQGGGGTVDPSLFGKAPNANISLISANETGYTNFLSAQPLRRHRGAEAGGPASPGPLVIENVAPGRYLMQAMPQAPWYVASASCGGIDLMREALAISGGAAGCSIRVALRNDPGSIHATVHDPNAEQGAPLGGNGNGERAFVYALPLGDMSRQIVPLGGTGTDYASESVAPGRYLVLALDHREELAYRDPDALRRYAGLGQEVMVSPNGKADAEVGLVTGTP